MIISRHESRARRFIEKTYETSFNEQESFPPEFPQRNTHPKGKLQTPPDERRRKTVKPLYIHLGD